MISWQLLTQANQTLHFVPATLTSFSCGTSGPFCGLHTLCALCCTLLCIPTDGLEHSMQTCHHLVVYFLEVDGNCFCISIWIMVTREEWPQPHTGGDVMVAESIAQVKALQANHGMGHALLMQVVVVHVELLQWLHQGLLPPLDLGLVLPGIEVLHVGSLFDLKKLDSPDCHPAHFKEAVVLTDSKIPLCFYNFISTPHTVWWLLPIGPSWASL